MTKNFLNIDNLSVEIDNKSIINNLNLKINKGEVHAVMGPNCLLYTSPSPRDH